MSFLSRKFLLTCFAMLVSAAGLFTGKLGEGSWVAVVTLILSVYGAASVTDKKLNPDQKPVEP